jgi:hypothetical protein
MTQADGPRCWCGERATTSHMRRVGAVPPGGHTDQRPDRSTLEVVRTCAVHAPHQPGLLRHAA